MLETHVWFKGIMVAMVLLPLVWGVALGYYTVREVRAHQRGAPANLPTIGVRKRPERSQSHHSRDPN